MLFVGNAFLGVVMPTTMVMALDPHPDIAGLASSLGGTLQMVTGGRDDGAGGAVLRRHRDADAGGDRAGGAARLRRGAPDLPAAAGARRGPA